MLACDLAEVNQVYHYTSFALLAFASAGRFAWLAYKYPRAVSPQVRRDALAYFGLGAATILTGFGVNIVYLFDPSRSLGLADLPLNA